jgi:ubiquitin carboxyl-terminal hydrolase L5
MFAYEKVDHEAAFSLLAICHSPIVELRKSLAINISQLRFLAAVELHQNAVCQRQVAATERTWMDGNNVDELAEYKLLPADVNDALVPQALKLRVAHPGFGTSDIVEIMRGMEEEQQRIRSDYAIEWASWEGDITRVRGRKKDYTSAIHRWVEKLAEEGHLQELMEHCP